MKKVFIVCFAFLSAILQVACSSKTFEAADPTDKNDGMRQDVEISLWTFPIGNWGNPTVVASLIDGFHKSHPNIHVSVECLSYESGDEFISQAIDNGSTPDLVFEGPERLVANWGNMGLLADLSDLWELSCAKEIFGQVRDACRHRNGAYYEFPICTTAHCMAINYDMFQAAGALQYIDEETRTWTTEGFIKAVEALRKYGQEHVAAIYCNGHSGDQGTRALVNNLYGGSFTDDSHTEYIVESKENIKALRLLDSLEGITFEPEMTAREEIHSFGNKELAMAFCWNVSQEISQIVNNPNLDFEILPMAFPTDSGQPRLQGGIWGFGVFDNGDQQRIEAAKEFIRYMSVHEEQYKRAVLASTYWPVREIENIYENDMLMTEYSVFMEYMADYYQITPGWTQARTAWWNMLQKIGDGVDISKAVNEFSSAVNSSNSIE